jgi:hypothetical protein
MADTTPVIAPPDGADGVDGPSVVVEGGWTMVARIRSGGTTELASWTSVDGREWTRNDADPSATDSLHALTERSADSDLDTFDANEIAAPSLVHAHGAWQLYYAGRNGSRWSIGLLISDDLVHWRPDPTGAALLAGDGSGIDALGTRDPEAVVLRPGTLSLFYAGTDGAIEQIGLTERAAPTE